MGDIDSLRKRLKAEFDAGARRIEAIRRQTSEAYRTREKRAEQFAKASERLRAVWGPRLEEFVAEFGDRVKVTPTVTPSQRDAVMRFTSGLASVELTLSAGVDLEAGNLVLNYDLAIVPILMEYEHNARLQMPLDAIDEIAIAKWIDDRLVAFVRTYNAMFENEHYLRDTMVEDPVAHVRFPKHAAAGSLERGGKTVWFVSAETRKAFEEREPAKGPKGVEPPGKAGGVPSGPAGAKPVGATPPPGGGRATP